MKTGLATSHGQREGGDFISLDQQIKEARRRAEEFNQKIQKTREEEEESIRSANEERKKWAVSYEEKTVMIEQLQRELASTVEALNVERKSDRYQPPAPVLPRTSSSHHHFSIQDHPTNTHLNYRSSTNHHHTTHSSDWNPPPPTSRPHATSTHSPTIENELRHEITNLKIENEQTKSAWKDSEAKISFYLSQIKQLEIEINLQSEEKKSSIERLRSIEKINQKFKTELEVMSSQHDQTKRSHEVIVIELQQTVKSLLLERERFEKTVVSRDEEITLLRSQVVRSERDRHDWEENLKELHRKEIELLHKHYQLVAQEQQQQQLQLHQQLQQQQEEQEGGGPLSPLHSPHHEGLQSRSDQSPAGRSSRGPNQTKVRADPFQQLIRAQDDIDHWLDELKHGHLESDGEGEGGGAGDEEEMQSRDLVVSPEVLPLRPTSSPIRSGNNSNGTYYPTLNPPMGTQTLSPLPSHQPVADRVVNPQSSSAEAQQSHEITSTAVSSTTRGVATRGTISHSILDMQSFSPPRVFLSHQTKTTHDSLRGDIFLSQFHQKIFSPTEGSVRRGYPTDLTSDPSPGGMSEIQLHSPERIHKVKGTSVATKAIQIRVPSGRGSPPRLQERRQQVYEVAGYHVLRDGAGRREEERGGVERKGAGQRKEGNNHKEKSKKIKPSQLKITSSASSSHTRSSSVPRQAAKPSRSSSSQPSRRTAVPTSLPSPSPYGRATLKTRQVSPFPRSTASHASPPVAFFSSRPRSAPTRSAQTKGIQPTHGPSHHATTPPASNLKRSKGNAKGKALKKSAADEVSLSLSSDYPGVWK
jgi:hypothetical protein